MIWLPPSSNLAPFLAFSRLTKQPPKNRQTPTILRLRHINFIPSSKLSFTHILGSSSRIQLVPDATSTLHCRQVLSDTKQTQQTFLGREMAHALSCMLTKVALSLGLISKHSSLFGLAPPGSLSGGRLPKSLAGLSKRSSYWSSVLVLPFSRSHAFFEFELLFSFSFLMGRPRDITHFRDRSQIQVKCRPSTRLLDCPLAGLQRLEPKPKPTVLPCQACYRPQLLHVLLPQASPVLPLPPSTLF